MRALNGFGNFRKCRVLFWDPHMRDHVIFGFMLCASDFLEIPFWHSSKNSLQSLPKSHLAVSHQSPQPSFLPSLLGASLKLPVCDEGAHVIALWSDAFGWKVIHAEIRNAVESIRLEDQDGNCGSSRKEVTVPKRPLKHMETQYSAPEHGDFASRSLVNTSTES